MKPCSAYYIVVFLCMHDLRPNQAAEKVRFGLLKTFQGAENIGRLLANNIFFHFKRLFIKRMTVWSKVKLDQ